MVTKAKATKPAPKAKATKPAPKLPAPQILKPTKTGPVAVNPDEAKLRDLTIAYVKGDQSSQGIVVEVAGAVAGLYKTREGFEAVKEAFQLGFILPGLDAKHVKAFEVAIPDGRTEDGKNPKWKAARKARATVQKILSQYFSRIRERAFPVEAEAKPTSLRTWTDDMLARIIKRHEKDDAGSPDVIKLLRKAQEANRLGDDEEGDE